MTSSSLADALAEFQHRGLVELDPVTGEVLLPDWFRFYVPRTPAARGAVESAINKILSTVLQRKVEKSYESMASAGKGKDKAKAKVKGKASSKEEEPSGGGGANIPGRSKAGIRCWSPDDLDGALAIEQKYGLDRVRTAVVELELKEVDPLPSRVSRALQEEGQQPIGAWWQSDAATIDFASQLGLEAYRGETMNAFRQRVSQHLQRDHA
ncbi:hypothetical protein [Cupriavidus pinatubonensis]|uniref:hypothetical protein n=1 Tax=Cupriavidus pinatubonensis TaxID=248026 RepID=UPI00362357F2